MMVLMLSFQLRNFSRQRSLAFHCLDELLTGQLIPGSGHDSGLAIMLPQQGNSCIQLCLGNRIGTGEDDGRSRFHLVVIKLTEVLHVELDLTCISNSDSIAQLHIVTGHLLHRADHIGQLANTGGLDDDPIGSVFADHLFQCLTEITHQAAADTAGVHLRDVDTGLLQEAAVDADFTKFVFNQH